MLGPNWIPPSDKDGMGDDVSWRDDPSVRQWSRPTPAARLRLGRSGIVDPDAMDSDGVNSDVAGLPDDHVVLVLVDGTPTLLAALRTRAMPAMSWAGTGCSNNCSLYGAISSASLIEVSAS